MSHAPEDRNRRIEAYVRGQADDETARQLEIEMLEDDELFERVQTEDLLRRGIGEAERPRSSRSVGEPPAAVARPRLAWALAASFGAVAVLLGIHSMQLTQRIETLQSPVTGVPVISLFDQRSIMPGVSEQAISLAGLEGSVFLEIDVSGYDQAAFQLELTGDRGRLVWEALVPDERGYLTVLAPRAQSISSIRVRSTEGEVLKSYPLIEE